MLGWTISKSRNWAYLYHQRLHARLLWGKSDLDNSMPSTGNLKGPSFSQHFTMTVICIVLLQVLLQALTVAVTYMYFNNEVKQLQDNYSKIGLACFSKEDGDFWDSTDEGILNRPCLQVKRQLYQLIEEVTLRTFEKTISTVPGHGTIRRRCLVGIGVASLEKVCHCGHRL
ncbi:tumor necrosis factor ligand superfamily member 10 isoform X2 [Rattus norvegicus]|uniref:tumor necrosis factor ligand superfamily member 10 isoform X2 n=1 Tax=Rattus norvegicus TaxID=10116 RepID=UPI002FD7F0AE